MQNLVLSLHFPHGALILMDTGIFLKKAGECLFSISMVVLVDIVIFL